MILDLVTPTAGEALIGKLHYRRLARPRHEVGAGPVNHRLARIGEVLQQVSLADSAGRTIADTYPTRPRRRDDRRDAHDRAVLPAPDGETMDLSKMEL
jgi:hypothetical protein